MPKQDPDIGAEQRLKAGVARSRRKKSLPESVWKKAKLHPAYAQAIEGQPTAVEAIQSVVAYELYLTRSARRVAKPAASRRQSSSRQSNLIPAEELRRAEVQARHFARLARQFGADEAQDESTGEIGRTPSEVGRFRSDFLGKRVATELEVDRILHSPAAAYLDAQYFRIKYSLIDHSSEVTYRAARPEEGVGILEVVVLEIRDGGLPRQETATVNRPRALQLLHCLHQGEPISLRVLPDTFFDKLRLLSERLAERYGWSPAESTMFILTDRVPATPCFSIQPDFRLTDDHAHAHLTIRIQAWVSTKTVARVYKAMQSGLLNQLQGNPEGSPQIHPTRAASLDLFDFVAERRNQGMTWRAIMTEWNASRPRAERYPKDGEQNFSRDFNLISQRLVHLRWPKRARSKSTKKAPARKK